MQPDLWAEFRRDQLRRNLRTSTLRTIRHRVYAFDEWLDVPLLQATPAHVESWLDSRNLAPRSRYGYTASLHSFYSWARWRGLIVVEPTADVPRPRLPRSIPRPISDGDLEVALRSAGGQMRVWLALAAFQGFRCMEIAGLRGEDVLTDRDPPLLVVTNGKGGHEAVLPLNRQVEHELRVFGYQRRGWVFRKGNGEPYKPGTVSAAIARYFDGLGIDATAHSLRHGFVSRVWARTRDMRITQEMARHATPATTSSYAAFDASLATEVVRNLSLNGHQERLL